MIDFKYCDFTKYHSKTSLKEILEKSLGVGKLKFYRSRNKVVFSSSKDNHSIIYKIPVRQGSLDFALALFSAAEKEGFGCFFVKNMLIYKYKGVEVYAQKKVDTFYDVAHTDYKPTQEIELLCKDYLDFVLNIQYVDNNEQNPINFYKWIEDSLNKVDKEKLASFLHFIK